MSNFALKLFNYANYPEFANNSSAKTRALFKILEIGLLDTLRIYYMRGFEKKEDDFFENKVSGNEKLHKLIQTALILTCDYLC